MSNKSGVAEQVISLPKGGGELQGLGESFSPDLHTGTGNFSVPITLPNGRNGFQPELGLVYSTGNGNTCFGQGWQLSIPGVSRKTSKGIPRYFDGDPDEPQDTFLLSGAEDLIPVEKGVGWIRYRPRTEGLFALITWYLDANNDYWEVKSKDGLVSYYGTPNTKNDDSATVYDPERPCFDPQAPHKVFSWHLSETRDVFNNRIIYEYEQDLECEIRPWNQIYLKRIQYLDYQDDNDQERFLVSVDFEYEEDRPDPFSVFTSGFEIRTRKLCKRILIHTHPVDEESYLVRSYEFDYDFPELSNTALLREVRVKGHDRDNEEKLPPLIFSYTQFDPIGKDFQPVSGRDFLVQSLADENTELIDLFGNGLPDIVQMNGVVRYWKNKGNGQFELPRIMREAPAGVSIADPNVQFMDANGEGHVDLVVHNNDISGYYPTQFDGTWDRCSFRKHKQAPTFNLQDPEVKLVDLNGDGITDVLRSGSRMECFFNDPEDGWNDLIVSERQSLEEFPNVNFSDPRVRLADMTGDGLQDIVFINNGNVEYWANKGYGKWSKRIRMSNSPRLPLNFDPKRLLVGDIAGDGPHDLIYIENYQIHLWINQNGNAFSDEKIIDGTPPVTDMDAVRLVDLEGTGTSGILWSADLRTTGREHYFFLDLTDGVKPYVLNEMNNNMGAITRVQYKPSTFYYLQDEQRKETRWETPLPFPVQVVSCVEVIDEISRNKLTTEYIYHHGYWDGAEREFRGFGRVEQVDTQMPTDYNSPGLHGNAEFDTVDEDFYTPPTLTKTWFHQGPVGPEHGDWIELDYSDEYWTGDPQKLRRGADFYDYLKSLPRRAQRDAFRSLRGSVLRTELFALDDDPNKDRPYTVSESFYRFNKVFSPEDSPFEEIPKGTSGFIFFPVIQIQRTTQWERGDDPMTQFSFTDDYDVYGNPRRQTSIACPREWRNMTDKISEEKPFLSTCGKTQLAYSPSDTPYIKGRTVKTSSYEVTHIGEQMIWDMKAAVDNVSRLNLLAQAVTYYDGEAFQGLPFGEIGNYGVPVRVESLVITEEIIQAAWQDENGDYEIPPYLDPGNNQTWGNEYPISFKDKMTPLAGYTFYDGNDEHARGYWSHGGTKFDFQEGANPHARGLPLMQRDALGREAHIEYDKYHFLPLKTIDPIGMVTQAEYDYRLFQANLIIDPNNNVSKVEFSPLGFPRATYVIGKEGVQEGDALDWDDTNAIPGSVNEYDWLAWVERRQPISVRTIVREHHLHEKDVPDSQKDDSITSIEFSDGFGRLVQTRTQAEDVLFGDPLFGNEVLPEAQDDTTTTNAFSGTVRQPNDAMNVVVSGWQIYDNKGQVVKKYEPFYDKGFDYAPPEDEPNGVFVQQIYDPLGRVVETLNPDGSKQKVVFGIPENLDNPDTYTATPWEAYTYDSNDNAGRTHPVESANYSDHWNTPASVKTDSLGRTIKAVARNGQDPAESIITKSTYDIRGNLLTVTDALERLAFKYSYDLTFDEENGSQVWRIESIDAGLRRMMIDVLGREVERRDNKGCISLNAYDNLDRPTHFWARDKANLPMTLRQKLIYGDTLSAPEDGWIDEKEKNLLGQLHQHYDEAGLVEIPDGYDFKGNPLASTRTTIKNEALTNISGSSDFQHFQIDWEAANEEDKLEEIVYQTNNTYDALNRPKQIHYPEDVDGERKVVIPTYNRAGALESISLNSPFEGFGLEPAERGQGDVIAGVKHIAYNAKGQRTLIIYENGLMTRYAYDDHRFWLKRLRTEKYSEQGNYDYKPSGGMLRDLGYVYDLTGNITTIKDRSPQSGVGGSAALDRLFGYDAIYRLISATGREHTSREPKPEEPWLQAMTHTDQNMDNTRAYTRQYTYDKAGNMLQLRHNTTGNGNFTRTFVPKTDNNQLASYRQGTDNSNPTATSFSITYDANGNMTQEGLSRNYYWNHADQLHAFRQEASGSVSLEARYLYDAAGQRVKKIVKKNGNTTSTTYIGGAFEYHTENDQANNTLHLMDDQSRIGLVRVGDTFDANDNSPAIQYQLGDHLGNVNMVTNEEGNWLNFEENYPYGETSFGSFDKKRYCFTGKEHDEESGLYYHGARYYASWLRKWVSCDPIGKEGGTNQYCYVVCNPMRFTDSTGLQPSSDPGNIVTEVAEFVKKVVDLQHGDETGFQWVIKDIYGTGKRTQEELNKLESALKKGSDAVSDAIDEGNDLYRKVDRGPIGPHNRQNFVKVQLQNAVETLKRFKERLNSAKRHLNFRKVTGGSRSGGSGTKKSLKAGGNSKSWIADDVLKTGFWTARTTIRIISVSLAWIPALSAETKGEAFGLSLCALGPKAAVVCGTGAFFYINLTNPPNEEMYSGLCKRLPHMCKVKVHPDAPKDYRKNLIRGVTTGYDVDWAGGINYE